MKLAKIFLSTLIFAFLASSLHSAHQQPGMPRPGDGLGNVEKQKILNNEFFAAARRGDTKAIEQLIPSVSIDVATEEEGFTALHLASLNGHEPVVKQLLNAGANKNALDKKGNTPLMLAAYKESIPTVETLLGAEADANICNKDGRKAYYCTWNWHVKNKLKPYTRDAW